MAGTKVLSDYFKGMLLLPHPKAYIKNIVPLTTAIGAGFILDELVGPTLHDVGSGIRDFTFGKTPSLTNQTEVDSIFRKPEIQDYYKKIIASDEVLQKADPKLLEQAFKTIMQVGQHIVKVPSMVITILKEVALYNAPIGYATIDKIINMENQIRIRESRNYSKSGSINKTAHWSAVDSVTLLLGFSTEDA
jgi:hypothetical protein